MRPSSLPFTRIQPVDEPEDRPTRREDEKGAASRSPTSGLPSAVVRRPELVDHDDNEPGKGPKVRSSCSSPAGAGRHPSTATPYAVPYGRLIPGSLERIPMEDSAESTPGVAGLLAKTPSRDYASHRHEGDSEAPGFVPHAGFVPSAEEHLGAPSVVRLAIVGLGLLLALLAIATSASLWSEAVHGLNAGGLWAWASAQRAISYDKPAAVPNAPLPSASANTAASLDPTGPFSDGADQLTDTQTTNPPAIALSTTQSISRTASASALASPIYSPTSDLPSVSVAPVTQPSLTAIPPSPTPTPELSPLSPTPTPPAGPPPANSPPTRLTIPRIGLDVRVRPVGYTTSEKAGETIARWNTRPNAASFHSTSALPGHPGNTVINGHRDIYGAVFYDLDKVRVGDQIILFVGEEAYRHEVAETRIIRYVRASPEKQAEHLRLMGSFPEERLTLLTCTPVGLATHRLYVIAKPLGGKDVVSLR